MRTITAFAVILIGNCLLAALEAKDIIRDKSPDGKFALRISHTDEGWEAEIIDLRIKKGVIGLELYQNNYVEGTRLVWSKDSQRVAYFEPDRRGGSTTVYFRKGSEFEEVSIPYGDPYEGDFAACEANRAKKNSGDTYGKDVEATSRPVKWLTSGELVLAVHFERLMENDTTRGCGQTITIAFASDHKASIKSAKPDDENRAR